MEVDILLWRLIVTKYRPSIAEDNCLKTLRDTTIVASTFVVHASVGWLNLPSAMGYSNGDFVITPLCLCLSFPAL